MAKKRYSVEPITPSKATLIPKVKPIITIDGVQYEKVEVNGVRFIRPVKTKHSVCFVTVGSKGLKCMDVRRPLKGSHIELLERISMQRGYTPVWVRGGKIEGQVKASGGSIIDPPGDPIIDPAGVHKMSRKRRRR